MIYSVIIGLVSFISFACLITGVAFLLLKKKKLMGILFTSIGGSVFLISCLALFAAFLFYVSEQTTSDANIESDYSESYDDEYSDEDYTELSFNEEGKSTEDATVMVKKPTIYKVDERGIEKYYKVDVKMRNDSKEPIYVSAKDFYLFQYDADDYADVEKKDYFHEKIDPGKSVSFSIYYEYLGDVGYLEMEYDNLIWN
ncbi:hypothetical protein X560_0611 [Listeria fleischmannii 1991]|uniref:DUF4352 domain-containing protein n=1 Tax=Listeria fleischmannii 1991 TaxID=1430899 RepID=A0A0J8GI99_9LIST|nr:DUF4352 domain-containing protein [Listeria fleischmannii]EMG27633.1 hypothetical protein LFLEISCH_10154 [Listeria fleischmannii subsp. fleischmannii LU2006-1]KMT60483.1 hypothetical protein X560_0611 [Listeria fleischmannii 1991]